jgi:hypothetical protein
MYCSLTCHIINREIKSLERHVQGKRYLKAKGMKLASLMAFMYWE